MSTIATVRFATREDGVSFSEHPKKWNAQFYKHFKVKEEETNK